MALRHPPSSHPIVSYTPYGLFWWVWVSVGCVYHVFALRDSCQSIQGETCRLNTLSRALYLTPGWFNPTPYTHARARPYTNTPARTHTPTSPVIHQYLHRGASIDPLHPASSPRAVQHQGQDDVRAGLISDRFTIKLKLLFNSSGCSVLFDLAPWERMSYSWHGESAGAGMVGTRFITQPPNV